MKEPEDGVSATRVKAAVVSETELVRTSVQPATVHAYYRAEIHARSRGYVDSLKADIGDVVEFNAELATVSVPELRKQQEIQQAQVGRCEAEEQRAQAGIDLADAQVQSAQAKLEEAKSQLSRADALLAAASAEFNRTQDLVSRGSLQNRMLDEARKKRDSEDAGKAAMVSSVGAAEAEVTVAKAQQASAEADLNAAKAETQIALRRLEELEVTIGYATLRAPFDGIVTQRNVELGDLVGGEVKRSAGGASYVVSQVDKVRVRIAVPENEAAHIKIGDSVSLSFPSFSGEQAIKCSVSRRSGEMNPNTRSMMIECDVENLDGKLIPGMFGQATIELSSNVAANVLPSRAIRFNETGEAYVYLIKEDQTIDVAPIQTGMDDGHQIEVRSGLVAGQQVVDAHLQRFSSGQKVTVIQ